MQLFGKPNRYTLFYYFILKTLPTPQRLSRQKAKGEVRFRFTPFSLHLPLSDGSTIAPLPIFYISLISCINYITIK